MGCLRWWLGRRQVSGLRRRSLLFWWLMFREDAYETRTGEGQKRANRLLCFYTDHLVLFSTSYVVRVFEQAYRMSARITMTCISPPLEVQGVSGQKLKKTEAQSRDKSTWASATKSRRKPTGSTAAVPTGATAHQQPCGRSKRYSYKSGRAYGV